MASTTIRFAGHVAREYVGRAKRVVGLASNRRPMMRYREVNLIDRLLQHIQPKRCLEWGCGRSTLFFPDRLDDDATWLSIEHNPAWHQKILGQLQRHHTRLVLAEPNATRWDDTRGDGSYDDFRDYVESQSDAGPFDFILIDGRARRDCLEKAKSLVSDHGVVVLHDANRKYLTDGLQGYEHQLLFTDYRTDSGGVWLGSNRSDLERLVDAEAENALWKMVATVGAILLV
ncbi:MAG: class I SAM-dependent methyltransferase [Polyangiales bacterium]|jgi:predicted O-methyltransferase YrrM